MKVDIMKYDEYEILSNFYIYATVYNSGILKEYTHEADEGRFYIITGWPWSIIHDWSIIYYGLGPQHKLRRHLIIMFVVYKTFIGEFILIFDNKIN